MKETSNADQDRRRVELNHVSFSLDQDEFRTESDLVLTIRTCCNLVQSLVISNLLSISQASEHK